MDSEGDQSWFKSKIWLLVLFTFESHSLNLHFLDPYLANIGQERVYSL